MTPGRGAALVDVNVLVAFLWPQHAHHHAAVLWFAAARFRGWASCPITQLGCVRVLSSQSQGALTVSAAAVLLNEAVTEAHHEFWLDSLPLSDSWFAASLPHVQGHGQLTDRYLLALAATHGGTLATLDKTIAAGLPADSPLLPHLEIVGD